MQYIANHTQKCHLPTGQTPSASLAPESYKAPASLHQAPTRSAAPGELKNTGGPRFTQSSTI